MGIGLGDMMFIAVLLLALGIMQPGLLFAWSLIFPETVERARRRFQTTPWSCFWLGALCFILSAPGVLASSGAESDLGMGLRQVATLVKAEVGLEVACLDVGGWDTHIAQGASEGYMANLLSDLGAGLAALHADLRDYVSRLVVVALSEFGRRAQENGGLGTDHGHGGVILLMGGGLRGGRVHGDWPGLQAENLVGPGDLAVTTDYRDVLGEIVQKRLRNPNLAHVFPDYSPVFRGVAE